MMEMCAIKIMLLIRQNSACGRQASLMALVLCTGVDPVLIKTRQLILQQAGHTVITAVDESAVTTACQQHTFEVAVIGQAVSPMVKRQIMELIRKHCPTAKILELYQFSTSRILEDADSWLAVPAEVPQELAERVTALARLRREAEYQAVFRQTC